MVLLSLLAFVVIFSFLILIHEFGHFYVARKSGIKVEEFGLGLGKKIWGKKVGEVEYTLNAVPFGGFVRMLGEEENSKDPRSFCRAALWKRMAVTVAGVCMNFLGSIILLTIVFTAGATPIITSQAELDAAEAAGLVEMSEPNEDGKRKIEVMHDIQLPFGEAFVFSLKENYRLTGVIVDKAVEIPKQLIQTGKLPEGLAGPVGIADVTHKVMPLGFIALLKLAALLSLSLAVMNLLPIPALDGGRLLFQLVELVLKPFKIKINETLENAVHLGGYVLLMLFLVAVTWNDIVKLLS